MQDGRVVADGPPGTVLDGPTLTALYRHPVVVAPHPTEGWPLAVAERGVDVANHLVLGIPNTIRVDA